MLKRLLTFTALTLMAAVSGHAAQWKIDQAHSSIGFAVRHMVVSKVSGNFTEFDGSVKAELADDGQLDLAAASTIITAKAASISTDNQNRDEHLRSADFFDAANYPDLTFVSTQVIPGEGGKFRLVGNLTMRGVTKEVTFEGELNGLINDPWGNTRAGFSVRATIDRQDFGVSWSKVTDNGGLVVSDNVDIVIELELIQDKPEVQG